MKRIAFFWLVSALSGCLLFARLFQSSQGWQLDPPEGFKIEVASSEVTLCRSLSTDCLLIITELPKESSASTEALSEKMATYIKSHQLTAEAVKVTDQLGLIEATVQTKNGPQRNIAAFYLSSKNAGYLLELKAPESGAELQENVWASLLDSFSPDANTYYSPGILTREAALHYPKGYPTSVVFGGELLEAKFSSEDKKASENLIDRETKILMLVKKDHFEAMSRFYRMIFRQAYPSFVSLEGSLRAYFQLKKMNDQEKIGFLCSSLYLFPSEALNGVGGEKIIESPIAVLQDGHGDCDSKALTLNLLLVRLGLEGQMLVSLPDQHALIGLPSKYFVKPQEVFTKSTSGDWLVAIELLQDPAKSVFKPENWQPIELKLLQKF
jgi:hypothetical protein